MLAIIPGPIIPQRDLQSSGSADAAPAERTKIAAIMARLIGASPLLWQLSAYSGKPCDEAEIKDHPLSSLAGSQRNPSAADTMVGYRAYCTHKQPAWTPEGFSTPVGAQNP
jgi:hypothetical protein